LKELEENAIHSYEHIYLMSYGTAANSLFRKFKLKTRVTFMSASGSWRKTLFFLWLMHVHAVA